ncbi:UDP-N-acetylglucosamine 2-epimerase (non-hydrolyzing) [Patescibacteria group bacterium]|nr:UDP-N-acetylglucosamine 2-epimerase (non-hydrolyzing) [Patescibacteria group bacterium]
MSKKIKVICVAAARPNFMKIAPLLKEFKKHKIFKPILVHTGQHYDYNMSGSFFKELNISKPNYNLGIKAGRHGEQTGKTMIEFEKVCLKEKPQLVIVVGDVNATLAGALIATKLHIPVAHIEAGLRSFDRNMPEEINRILTDHISDYLFVTCEDGKINLINEGINKERIFLVGNIMIDTLLKQIQKSKKSKILIKLNLKSKEYALVTLHRPTNVDKKKTLKTLLQTFNIIQKEIKIIYPIHPRTKKQIKKFGLEKYLKQMENFITIPPLGYLDMICLLNNAKLLLTDSGSLQEESTALKIPCLTLRPNTERPVTVNIGTNIIVNANKNKIIKEINKILSGKEKGGKTPPLWDGKAAQRIVKILSAKLIKKL